jgi:type II secretory pathway component PulF
MKDEDLIALNEEIAGMARAGLPLDQGLAAIAGEMGHGELQRVTLALAADLRSGQSLPEALERQRNRVPPFYASLVAAGIRSGRFAEVLATLTVYARTIAGVRTMIREALFYPLTVLAFGFGLLFFLCFFVLPKFAEVFREFEMKLPAVTEFMMLIMGNPLRYLLYPLVVLIALVASIRGIMIRSEEGRCLWANFCYSIPILGTLLRAARLAAFADLLAILVDHEVPLPEALELAGAASADPVMASTIRDVVRDLNLGMPLAEALRGRGLVPAWVSWMAGVGEKRGNLGQSLRQVAEIYRRQVELRAALVRNVLPPFLIISMAGVFIILFVGTVMSPMYKLLEGLSK